MMEVKLATWHGFLAREGDEKKSLQEHLSKRQRVTAYLILCLPR